jgi:hypothetical protein
MTDKNLFKIAARRKTRFASTRGDLTAEQLYDLKLTDLDIIGRNIQGELKGLTEDSLIELTPDPRKGHLQDALDLVKEVIADKLADKATAEKRAQKAALRRTLTDALARKQDEALSTASIEDLQNQLAALDDED